MPQRRFGRGHASVFRPRGVPFFNKQLSSERAQNAVSSSQNLDNVASLGDAGPTTRQGRLGVLCGRTHS